MILTKQQLADIISVPVSAEEFDRLAAESGVIPVDEREREDELIYVPEVELIESPKWTKFDPDNPDTFPPNGKVSIIATKDGRVGTSLVQWVCDECGFVEYYRDEVSHWYPLPKHPLAQ